MQILTKIYAYLPVILHDVVVSAFFLSFFFFFSATLCYFHSTTGRNTQHLTGSVTEYNIAPVLIQFQIHE